MRRLILFLLLALSVFPLLALHIISDGSLPDDVLSVVAEAVGRDPYGRSDILCHADGYSETILSDGSVSASFMFSFLEKQILTEGFGTDREELLRSFAYSVHGILFYEEALYSDAQMKLDYVLDGSYSLLSEENMRKGTRLKAVDSLGSTRALFEIRDNFDGAMTLDPVYIDYPLPGMAIEDSGEWKMTGTIASGFRFSSPEVFVQFSLGRTDLIYPFVPLVSLAYRYGEGGSYVYGGVGLEAYLNLSRVFPSVSFTLVEEGRIGGNVSVLLGGGSTGFDWRSVFSIFYEHRALPSFFWRVGYQNLQGEHMLAVGVGGDF